MSMETKNIMIVGVGGQGSLLASKLLGQLLLTRGYDVKVSEVHGMSQRGGSVVTYVRYGERVCSPVIDAGEADCIIAFELLEAARLTGYLKPGVFGAEPWTNEMRRQIEEQLGLKAFDIYGLTEIIGPGVAFECDEQSGMHINEDHFIVEVIDPETGRVLPEGEQGELVFSAITKEAFPILRYRTRDIGVISTEKCACGRTLVKMTKPRGRTDDMLIVRGVNVFPSQIESVLLSLGYPANYRIVVDRADNNDSIEVQVEISNDVFSDTVRGLTGRGRQLENALKSLLGIAARVKLLEPGTIERSTGKAVRVIDKRKLLD